MKTKTRTANFNAPASMRSGYYDDAGWGGSNGALAFQSGELGMTFSILSETISYEEPRKKSYGDCLHTRVARSIIPSGGVFRQKRPMPSSPYFQKIIETDYYWPILCRTYTQSTRTPVIRPYSWKTLSAQAMDELMPTFSEGGESVVNFMLELKQLKDLPRLWSKSRSFLKNVSGAHLNVSFGWMPFLSDVERLRLSLLNFQKKLDKLQRDSGKPITRHFRRYMDHVDLLSNVNVNVGTVLGSGYPACFVTQVMKWVERPRYCATIRYSYVLPDMSDVKNKIKGFLDSLGVQWNPSIAWNAVPYSFVVDWFFGVGDWLNQLRTDNLSIPATVTSFCHSVKFRVQDEITLLASDGRQIPLAYVETLRYERRKDIPSVGLFDSTVKAPSTKQVLLGASLVAQRI